MTGAVLLFPAACSHRAGSPFVNPAIASHYQAFYDAGTANDAEAKAALDKARRADPDNAYTVYLEASLEARNGNLNGALALLQKANKMEKVVIYVSAPPPDDSMQSLNRLRQLGFTVDKSGSLGGRQLDYIRAIEQMGRRIANAEPMCSLSVVNGVGILRKAAQGELAYWTSKRDDGQRKKAEQKLASISRWYDDFNRKLAANLGDLVREAGRKANLTEQELDQYAKGIELEDRSKQAKADQAKSELYKKEVQTLREAVKTLP